MNTLYLYGALAVVVIVLVIFAVRTIIGLSKSVGEGKEREAQSDELFRANTRRQKMARRARARGRRLAERVSKWSGGPGA